MANITEKETILGEITKMIPILDINNDVKKNLMKNMIIGFIVVFIGIFLFLVADILFKRACSKR